eukprot:GHVS01050527.1.p1 GENE.GHVS01050527.1~~GHVS01050527.1.p1  ORF type:complete len:128 (+),score=5.25 GHVS01050527.1:288-671(+)
MESSFPALLYYYAAQVDGTRDETKTGVRTIVTVETSLIRTCIGGPAQNNTRPQYSCRGAQLTGGVLRRIADGVAHDALWQSLPQGSCLYIYILLSIVSSPACIVQKQGGKNARCGAKHQESGDALGA